MKITRITQQVKQVNRYSVYVDKKYSFSLSETALIKCAIASGQELTEQQIEKYKQLSVDDKAYARALRYVAMRQRTTWEIETYLARKQLAEPLISDIVQRLADLSLLNDAAYAISFVHDRQLLRPTSRRKLILELKKKHISDSHIQAALEAVTVDENDNLRDLITKKRRQSKYQDDTKLMQYLARQGFGYGDIKAAIQAGTIAF